MKIRTSLHSGNRKKLPAKEPSSAWELRKGNKQARATRTPYTYMPSRRMPLRRSFLLFSRHTQPHHSKPNHVYPRNLPPSLLLQLSLRALHIRSRQRSQGRICASTHNKTMGESGEGQTSPKAPSALREAPSRLWTVSPQAPGPGLYSRPVG